MRFALDEAERVEDLKWQHTLALSTAVLNWAGFGKRKAHALNYLYEQTKKTLTIKKKGSGSLKALRKKLREGKIRSLKRKRRNA